MKPIHALLPLLLILTACTYTTGNGVLISKNIETTPYEKISLQWQGDLHLAQGNTTTVQVEGESNIIDHITITTEGDTLTIKKAKQTTMLRPTTTVKYYLTTPDIKDVTITGSGDLHCETPINGDRLAFTVTGSGDIKCDGIRTDRITTTITGSGDLYLSDIDAETITTTNTGSGDTYLAGTAERHDYEVSSSGDLLAQHLATEETTISIAGTGDARVSVEDDLDISIAGTGDVYYDGNPETNQRITGSGDVLQLR
ncbi:DUF2807 domain-containing protein [Candidatus Woesearchaeota archaeon]|nr:DUF2807 domain-containing protein [Candidatus Woesearchaeota archaeon]